MWDRIAPVCLLSAALGVLLAGPTKAHAAGEILWQFSDTPLVDKQEAVAAAVDAAGCVVVTGYTEGSDADLHTVKFKADGSGYHWRANAGQAGVIDKATDVVVDGNGDVIVVGYLRNGADDDIYVAKYASATGAVLWEHSYDPSGSGDDHATGVAVDGLNNVYVGAYSPSAGASPKDDYYILKYAPGGPVADEPMWKIRYEGGFDGHDRITDIHADASGVAVTGTSQNATNFDVLTVKFDSNGGFLWQQRYGFDGGLTTTNDTGQVVRMDAAGNVIVGGYGNNGIDRDIYVAKYQAADGVVLWEKPLDTGFNEEIADLYVDSLGDVYVTGYGDTLTGASDLYIARHAAVDGTRLWSDLRNTVNGNVDTGVGVTVDEFGEVFVTGSTYVDATGQYDFVTFKYKKADGTQLWPPVYFDGAASQNDRPVWIGQNAAGDLLVAGWTDTWTAGASDYDYVVVKHDPGLLNAPTGLSATTVSETEIALVWSDNSTSPNEEHFSIERRDGVAAWAEVTTVPTDTISYNDTGLTPDTRYTYRVRGYTAADGYSHYSNEDDDKTTIISYEPPAWTKLYDNGGQDEATAVAAGPDGHPVVAGFSYDATGSFDYYTLKLDRANFGAELWNARYNDGDDEVDMAEAVVVDQANRVVVTGYSSLFGGGISGNTNDLWTIGYPATGPTGPIQPNWSWADQYNGPAGDDDRSSAIAAATDGSDNVAVVGYGKNASANDDIYVLKYTPAGVRSWAAIPHDGGGNDYPTAVAFTPAGDVVVAGYTHDGTGYDGFVAKYLGGTGVQDWATSLGGPGDGGDYGNDYAEAITVDAAGDVYITGSAVNSSGNTDIYTAKLNGATGAVIWDEPLDGPANGDDAGAGIGIDQIDGQVVVAGSRLAAVGQNDYTVARYAAADGALIWNIAFERPEDDLLWAVAMDSSGNVCLAGQTDSGTSLDMLATKVDYLGDVVAATVYDGPGGQDDVAMAVAGNRFGETFVAGYTTNASGNSDYAIFACSDPSLQTALPLTASAGFTQVDLTWSDNSLDNDGYDLERKVGTCAAAGSWSPIHTAGANDESYQDTGLSVGGTDYCYRIQAYKSNGDRSRWAQVEATTLVPTPPADLAAAAASTTEINLSWTDTTNGEADWEVKRCAGPGCSNFTVITTLPPGSESFLDETIQDSTTYRYVVEGVATGWSTLDSNVAEDTTPVPVAPTGLAVSWTAENRLDLVWSQTTPDETEFVIERCTVDTGCLDWADLPLTAGVDSVAYGDTTVQPNTTYRYRVRARKITAWHTWNSATTNEDEATATAPAPVLTVSSPNSTRVDLDWTNTTASETGFEVERCNDTLANCTTTPTFVQVGGSPTTGANVIAYADQSVANGQTYTYRVRAVGSSPAPWASPDSVWRQIATATATAPSGYAVAAISESEVQLDWSDSNADEEGFRIWRCEGPGCSSGYVQVGGALPPVATSGSYIDTTVAIGVTYGYYVEVYKDTPTQPWSLTTATQYATPTLDPPTLTDATASVGTDCGEVRFSTDPNGSSVLDYWIESGCSTDQTRAHVKVPSLTAGASDLYFFTGNIAAVSMSDADAVFEYFDDFRGTTIDTSKWIKVGDNSISQNDGLVLTRISNSWRLLVSSQTFTRSPGRELYMRLTTGASTANYYNDVHLGWYRNYTGASTSYNSQTIFWDSGTARAYDYRYNRGTVGTYSPNTEYETKVVLESSGAQYWIKGGGYSDWTVASDTASYNFTPVRVSILQYGADMTIHLLAVRTHADVEPTVTAGASTLGSYALPGGTWSKRQTLDVDNPGGVLNNYQLPLSVDTSTLATDQVVLSWTDTTEGETDFVIERCEVGVSCPTFTALPVSVGPNATTYTDRTVEAGGKTYQYRVKAVTDLPWAETGYSNVMSATTVDPLEPFDLQVAATGESSVNLTWVDRTDNETRFVVERCEVGVDCPAFTPLPATPPANAESFVDDTVCPNGAQYTYRVRAEREGVWTTLPSNEITATTLNTDAPTTLVASAVSESEIALSWVRQTVDEDGFTLERCDGACVTVDVPGNAVTNFTDSGLSPSTTYTYRVKAYGSGTCPWESPYNTTPASEPTLTPPAPSGLMATKPNTTQLDLDWVDESGSETLYHVYRCEGSGCTPTVEISVPALAADTEAYSDPDVKAGTTYVYKVEAHKDVVPEWRASTTLETTTTSPLQPQTLVANKISEVEVYLTWSYTQADETGFTVERCQGAGCSSFAEVAQLAAGATAYTDTSATGLSANQQWRYRVSPVKTGVTHPWTNLPYSTPADVDTLPIPPSAVLATATSTTDVSVNWTSNTPTATGFEIWRCTGAGCNSGYSLLGTDTASPYTDDTAAHTNTYGYQVRAANPAWTAADCASTTAYASTGTPLAPILQPATVFSDTSVLLDWTIQTTDESGFSLERCETAVGSTCSNFSTYEPALPAAVGSYADVGALPSKVYCYRVNAYKTAVQAWGPLASAAVCATMPPAQANAPTLTAINARMIRVEWTAAAVDEDGFDIEVKAENGRFVVAGTVGPDVHTYVDNMGIEPETDYTYRVTAFRGTDRAPPSGEATATSLDVLSGTDTCVP